jgi:pre-mRNA-splicing factor ISY1
LSKEKGQHESPIVELGSPNYSKVGPKMIDLEGNEVDVLGATDKGLGYKSFGSMEFLPILKELFDNSR